MIVRKFVSTIRVLRSITRMPNYSPPMCHLCSKPNNDSDGDFPLPPRFIERPNETLEEKRSRLLYQSRKRGTLESGLILSTFASMYLDDFNPSELSDYDTLINEPTNEWDIYYWATGSREVPEEYRTGVMELLVRHAQNDSRDARFKQPDLVPKDVT